MGRRPISPPTPRSVQRRSSSVLVLSPEAQRPTRGTNSSLQNRRGAPEKGAVMPVPRHDTSQACGWKALSRVCPEHQCPRPESSSSALVASALLPGPSVPLAPMPPARDHESASPDEAKIGQGSWQERKQLGLEQTLGWARSRLCGRVTAEPPHPKPGQTQKCMYMHRDGGRSRSPLPGLGVNSQLTSLQWRWGVLIKRVRGVYGPLLVEG